MEKFLLTCFLALLCLYGSTTIARVADSPTDGADLVDKVSGPHRGGETRPDTYSSEEFGLFDKYLDPGAGEETSGSLPAPVTVSAHQIRKDHKTPESGKHRSSDTGHPTPLPSPVSACPPWRGLPSQYIGHLTPSTRHRSSFSLVDQYLDSGAGEGSYVLQSGPITVSTQVLKGKETVQEGSDGESLGSCVLHLDSARFVDTSTSPGQEGGISSARFDSLKIGDKIPTGIEFRSVLRYNADKLRLDDFKGKFLILEFWAPTCTGSIASLPVMDKINQKYGEQIQVVPLTIFSEDRLAETLEGYKSLNALDLPMVADASKLRAYFPHSTIPHLVILDPDGVVVAITGMEDLTEENLDSLLQTGVSSFRLKEDHRIFLDPYEKLISQSFHVPNKNIWFQSALTGYLPAVSGSLIQRYEDFSHIRIVNMALYSHYQLAYSERSLVDYFGTNRIEAVGFGPEEIFTKRTGADYREWMEEGNHVFGYELIAPPAMNPYELMREDLKRFFPGITATVAPRMKKVYAIVQQPGQSYSREVSETESYETTTLGVRMTRYPLQGFVYHLNVYFFQTSQIPIVNRTGIDYPIDLELNAQLTSIESLRQALRQNGLDLIEREEQIPVLVLTKTVSPNSIKP
jgi:thiol-disulfide isomerase/thioredoxin